MLVSSFFFYIFFIPKQNILATVIGCEAVFSGFIRQPFKEATFYLIAIAKTLIPLYYSVTTSVAFSFTGILGTRPEPQILILSSLLRLEFNVGFCVFS